MAPNYRTLNIAPPTLAVVEEGLLVRHFVVYQHPTVVFNYCICSIWSTTKSFMYSCYPDHCLAIYAYPFPNTRVVTCMAGHTIF